MANDKLKIKDKDGAILAVAWTDLDGDGVFNAKTDALIAAVQDTNQSGTIDPGDTVVYGTYPLHVDGTAGRGTFTQASETITGATFDALNQRETVTTATGNVVFQHADDNEFFETHIGDGSVQGILIVDGVNSGGEDHVRVEQPLAGPGAPDTTVNIAADQFGDQPFLDVFIG